MSNYIILLLFVITWFGGVVLNWSQFSFLETFVIVMPGVEGAIGS